MMFKSTTMYLQLKVPQEGFVSVIKGFREKPRLLQEAPAGSSCG